MTLPGKATHQQTRGFNRGLVLRTLYDYGPVSRAEVARLTGLTRTTVSELVGDVLDARASSREVGLGPSSRRQGPDPAPGRRRRPARGRGRPRRARVRRRARQPPRRGPRDPRASADGLDGDEALAALTALVDELVALAPETSPILGIGVGTPGLVDATTGTIRWAVNLDWQDLPLGQDPHRAHRPAGERRQRLARRGARRIPVRGAPARPEPRRGQGRPGHRRRDRHRGRGLQRRRLRRRRDRPHGDRRRRRGVPLRPVRLPRDRRQLARDRPRRDRGGERRPRLAARTAPRGVGNRHPDARRRRAGARRRRRDRPPGGRRGRALARASRSPRLIGASNIRRIVLLGSVTTLGEPWLTAVARRGPRRSLAAARRRHADRRSAGPSTTS